MTVDVPTFQVLDPRGKELPSYEAGEALVEGDILYFNASGQVIKLDTDADKSVIGVAAYAVASGDQVSIAISGMRVAWGLDASSQNLTLGSPVYADASETPQLAAADPGNGTRMGIAAEYTDDEFVVVELDIQALGTAE